LQRVLTTATLIGLLVATAAAFAITEHLKLIKSSVAGIRVSKTLAPVCHCAGSKATIRIRLRRRDRATVTIVDSGHHTVATIASGALVLPNQGVNFVWRGLTDTGARAPDGLYYPEVYLAHARRKYLFLSNRIVLDTQTPKVLSAGAGNGVLFVGGRGIAIRYAFSEPANAVVFLGRQQIIRGRPTRTHAAVKWSGRVDGRPVRAGAYVLSVAARDAAGNETPVSARKTIRVVVRYIEVTPRVVSVSAGGRFKVRIETKAARYTWRLGRRHGAHRGKELRLRAPTTRGRYRLVVAEHGHTATAVVRVRSK
jgi:hypothetical protein